MQHIIKYLLLVLQISSFVILYKSSFYSQKVQNSSIRQEYNIRILSFSAPLELKFESDKGIDSEIWRYNSPNIKLTIDYGFHSEKPSEDKSEDNYIEKSTIINKKKATIVFFKFKNSNSREFKYVAAVYFTRIGTNENKLSFVAYCKSTKEQKIAERIFRSIKFKKQKKQ